MVMQTQNGYVPHRDAEVTATNKGPIIDIAAWFIMVAFILAIMMRFAIKRFVMSVSLVFDDLLLFLAMLVDILQVIFVSLSVHYGLGRPVATLTPSQITNTIKMVYATDITYFAVAGLAKVSILLLIYRLCEAKAGVQKFCRAAVVFVSLWALAGVIAIGLQCGFKGPWVYSVVNSPKCANIIQFWEIMCAIDILTEIFIIACPLALIWGLSTPLKSRLIVAFAFSLRLWVVIAIIIRVIDIRRSLRSADFTFNNVYTSIATQCVLGLEIVTACTLVLKPFLHAFDSGMLGISLRSSRFSGVSGGYSRSTSLAFGSLGQNEQPNMRRLDGGESKHMRQFRFPANDKKEQGLTCPPQDPLSFQNVGGLDLGPSPSHTRDEEKADPHLNSYGSTTPLNMHTRNTSTARMLQSNSGESRSASRGDSFDSCGGVQVHFADGNRPGLNHYVRSRSSGSMANHLNVQAHHPQPSPGGSSLEISPFDEHSTAWV